MSMTISLAGIDNEALELNVSDSNFWSLCEFIGQPVETETYEYKGEEYKSNLTPSWRSVDELLELKERVVIALEGVRALPAIDCGSASNVYVGEFGATVIDCGRSEGYYEDRLTRLLTIVDAALDAGVGLLVG